MTTRALHFLEVDLRRAPGCARGWRLRNLSPGINVIVGPNASGKTTTARALTTVLWPATAEPRTEIVASFSLEGATWHAEIDGGHAIFQREGQPAERPPMPAAETMRGRCNVALHDLLKTGDDEIAREILREAAGGFDIDAVARELGFDERARFARGIVDEFHASQRQVQGIEQDLRAVATESARLGDLANRIDAAKLARDRAGLVAQAIEKRRHLAAHDAAKAELARFDARLEKVAGNELIQFEEKQRTLEALREQADAARDAIAGADAEIAECHLPDGGIPEAQLTELHLRLDVLRSKDVELDRLKYDAAAAQAREEQARQVLGADEQCAALDLPALGEIAAFSREWDDLHFDQTAAQHWREWLGEPGESVSIDALREAAFVLGQWLRSPTAPPDGPRWLLPALLALGALIALGSVSLALTGVRAAWIGFLLGLAVLAVAFALRARVAASPSPMFPSGGVEPPHAWETGAVQERLEEIQRAVAAGLVAEERRRALDAREPERERLAVRRQQLEAQRRTLSEELGREFDPRLFTTFVQQLAAWREARAESATLVAKIAEIEVARDTAMAAIRETLAPFEATAPRDLAAAAASIDHLGARAQRWRTARQEAIARQRELGQFGRQSARIEGEIAAIFAVAQVSDATALTRLLEGFDNFKAARNAENAHRGLSNEAAKFFCEHAGLESPPVEALELEREEAAALGRSVEALVEEKASIETKIDGAKRRTALEDAVARREVCKRTLLDDRDAKLDALGGQLIATHLREQMSERAMGPVFDRAREFFGGFTAHAWELVPPDEDGVFRARDTVAGGASRGLDELSSGTRVQLLLAVRAAFVAGEERAFDVQLPLFLDETLANSDDRRAQQIIEAIAELARDGRQIFYFTAQADEVAKWREFFSAHSEVPHHIADLAVARGEAATPDFERIAQPPPISAPPPGELSYDEYSLLVGVPQFDPQSSIGAVHLWHMCEDTATLHGLLAMGFERWGQIEDVLRHNGEKLIGSSARLRANARLIEELCLCWQHGRGRALVREALTEAGVSGNFIDRVWKVACNLGRDAQRLLNAMNRGEIPRLQKATIERFREYCEESGYVSRETPLDAAVIRGRIQALAIELGVDMARVDALLAKILA